MKYDEFLERVRRSAGLDSPAAAEQAARAALGTLGECLYRTEQASLAAQLPRELGEMLGSRGEPETTRRHTDCVKLGEFYNRMAARADLGHQQAVRQSRAVMAVTRAAVSPGVWDEVRRQFPPDYDDVLMADAEDLGPPTIRMDRRPPRT